MSHDSDRINPWAPAPLMGGRTPVPYDLQGGRTPAYGMGGRTPAMAGGRTPAYGGQFTFCLTLLYLTCQMLDDLCRFFVGATPGGAWNPSSRTPRTDLMGGKTPGWGPMDARTPAGAGGTGFGRTPAGAGASGWGAPPSGRTPGGAGASGWGGIGGMSGATPGGAGSSAYANDSGGGWGGDSGEGSSNVCRQHFLFPYALNLKS